MAHYYPVTISEIRQQLRGVIARRDPQGFPSSCHLVWMCDQVEGLDPHSPSDAAKAGRWVGWLLARMEDRGWWNNTMSRDMVRADVLHNHDRPLEMKA